MSIRLKTFLFIIWALAFIYMIIKMKTKRSDIRFILPWFFLDILMCIVTAFPSILIGLCSFFGIVTPSNMMFFFGMIFLVMIIFSMTLQISKLNEQIRDLSQRLALKEHDSAEKDAHDTDHVQHEA